MLQTILNEPRPFILLIDDDEDDLEMLSSSLVAQGMRTMSFTTGWKAIYYLNFFTDGFELPEFIISDFNMPEMNGSQLLGLLKNNKVTADIPVLIYSTHMPAVFKNSLINLGAFDCLAKPFLFADLSKHVEYFKRLASSFSAAKV